MLIFFIIFSWIFCGVWCADLAVQKGRNSGLAVVVGLLLGIFGVLAYLIAPDLRITKLEDTACNNLVYNQKLVRLENEIKDLKERLFGPRAN